MSDYEKKVVKVAKAMCRGKGFNPGDKVLPYPEVERGAFEYVVIRDGALIEQWTLFVGMARDAIEAINEFEANE
jgi:hypothetical protein